MIAILTAALFVNRTIEWMLPDRVMPCNVCICLQDSSDTTVDSTPILASSIFETPPLTWPSDIEERSMKRQITCAFRRGVVQTDLSSRTCYVPARALRHSSPSFINTLPTSLISMPKATLRSSSATL